MMLRNLKNQTLLRCKAHTTDVRTSGRMLVDRKKRALALGALLASALALGGCRQSLGSEVNLRALLRLAQAAVRDKTGAFKDLALEIGLNH